MSIIAFNGPLLIALQCDAKRPKCGLCATADHDCRYRDMSALLFHDETSTVISRIRKKQARSSSADTPFQESKQTNTCTSVLCLQDERTWDSLTVTRLTQSYADVAIHQWLTKYVQGSHFEFLASFCETATLKEPFRSAVTSVALAHLANEVHWERSSEMSWMHYNKAIRETQKVIEDPQAAQSDDALAAVLLLSSFESISPDVHASTKAWIRHIHGACAMLNARGVAFLATPFGQKAAVHIATCVGVDCVQSHTRLTPDLQSMMDVIAVPVVSGPRQRFQIMVGDLINLRASIAEGVLMDSSQIVCAAEKLDEDGRYVEWELQRRPEYHYEVVQAKSADHDDIPQHVYRSPHATQLWNTLRMHRIITNSIILSHLPVQSDGFVLFQRYRATTRISSMCLDICASVYPGARGDESVTVNDCVATANFAIWPLFLAGSSTFIPAKGRDCAINTLTELGARYRNSRALVAAAQLERGDPDDSWMHVSHMF